MLLIINNTWSLSTATVQSGLKYLDGVFDGLDFPANIVQTIRHFEVCTSSPISAVGTADDPIPLPFPPPPGHPDVSNVYENLLGPAVSCPRVACPREASTFFLARLLLRLRRDAPLPMLSVLRSPWLLVRKVLPPSGVVASPEQIGWAMFQGFFLRSVYLIRPMRLYCHNAGG